MSNKHNDNKNNNENIDSSDLFKIPIEFIKNKYSIAKHIKNDLELTTDNENSLYVSIFSANSTLTKLNLDKICSFYTTDKLYLKNTQTLLNTQLPLPISNKINNIENVLDLWRDISNETSFIEKYQFVDWQQLKFLNNNQHFLQFFSLYNLSTPVLSLAMPIFILIIPFFIIRLQGYKITPSTYIDVLKQVLQKHSLGQILFINNVDWDKKIYLIMTFVFYVLQVYYNIQTCIRFIKNFNSIHSKLFIVRDYLQHTLSNITEFKNCCNDLVSYQPFIEYISIHEFILKNMYQQYSNISNNKLNFTKIGEIGHIMKCFYQLYNHQPFKRSFTFSIYFNGFLENLFELQNKIKNKKINLCTFNSSHIKKQKNQKQKNQKQKNQKQHNPKQTNKKSTFKQAYYPTMIDSDCIKNDYSLDKQMIITGPNAAGKTTLLKTTLINVIFSQQFACGFYKNASITLYDFIHCYINIPDTSQRDSLFQAEARRCKDILTTIYNNKDKNHFCVFDELFSGTNPYEAISSAVAFLKHINTFNVSFVITTHFIDLCKYLDNVDNMSNYQMNIIVNSDNTITYTYYLIKGISTFKGAVSVLKELNYPNEIITETMSIINSL
jgi:hypothetical protein